MPHPLIDSSAAEQAWVIPDWPAPTHVRAAVSTRMGPGVSVVPFERFNLGTRCGDGAAAVATNREALIQALGLPTEPRWLRQVHGIEVATVDRLPVDREPVADASTTALPGTVLAILTADCLPVLFCADDGSEIAAAHAGWRGLEGGVLEETLRAMRTPAQDVLAWLGPCIGASSYEVGDEVRKAFLAHDPRAEPAFVPTRPGHWLCDLVAIARMRLRAAGVRQVHGGGFDTLTDQRFYSYRRDATGSGRFASLIWMDMPGR
jgi:polyphenol oxidase